MEEWADAVLRLNVPKNIDYYQYCKEKFVKNIKEEPVIIEDNLKDKLIEFRTARSKEMNIPAYYVYTNEELDKLVELRPKELQSLNILTPIKIKTHGELIISIINNK